MKQIQRIIDKRQNAGKTFYKIKFLGYSSSYNQWVPQEDIIKYGYQKKLKQFYNLIQKTNNPFFILQQQNCKQIRNGNRNIPEIFNTYNSDYKFIIYQEVNQDKKQANYMYGDKILEIASCFKKNTKNCNNIVNYKNKDQQQWFFRLNWGNNKQSVFTQKQMIKYESISLCQFLEKKMKIDHLVKKSNQNN